MQHAPLLALAVSVAALGLTGSVLVYVAVSYAFMRAHVEHRPLAHVLREALREVVWALLTQSLLPLFYVLGRRLARGAGGVPIVAVHGYMQNRVDFLRLAQACSRAGLGPVYGFNYPWFGSIQANAQRMALFVDAVCRETGASRVDLVGHSLGGLVALELAHHAGGDRVRRVVTVASPHAGVAWRGPIVGACGPELRVGGEFVVERADRAVGVPCLSVYSTHDNVVHPPLTSALARRGGSDRSVAGVGHLAILFHPDALDAIVAFLRLAELGEAEGVPAGVGDGSAVGLEPERELAGA
jgi:pimeloyl-ACP methyl ester carboxylesterase